MTCRNASPLLRAAAAGWVGALIVIPVVGLVIRAVQGGLGQFWQHLAAPTSVDALQLTFTTAASSATVNGLFGTLIAWALVRRTFPGKAILSALVDVPFAIPTLVTGVVLVALLGPQTWAGRTLVGIGSPIVFARPGIVLAMLFISLPLVVRTVEPVLAELDPNEEDAAATLGASRWHVFRHVLMPAILPAIAAGWTQAFARCIAEFGSIAALSGNIPGETLVASVHILGELEAGSPASAAAISVILLAAALALQPLSSLVTAKRRNRV